MFMGIIDSAPDIDVESIVPMGYATTIYDSAGNLTDTLVMAGANREEAAFLTERDSEAEMAAVLLEAGVGHVLIKNGGEGCYIRDRETEARLPAFRNEHLVDTIGAGDNFAAGFVTALLDGMDFAGAARFANATASISVGAPGSTNGVRSKEQVMEFLRQQ